jgi:hypothetical protein
MKLRESILIIVSVGLLSSTVYFMQHVNKLNKENEKAKNELLAYKKSVQMEKEEEAKKLELLKIAQDEKKKKEYRKKLRLDVKDKIQNAYELAQRLEEKYKKKSNRKSIIIEALNQRGVYIKSYTGKQVGDINSSYLVDGLRAIPLEEIQKVRRHKEGYIKVDNKQSNAIQYVYVKNLEIHQLFIGASAIFR